ncbi:nickel ABC transporter permease [Lachnotalea glycerini]|uniref:Nickel import system permease protein NikB n=1 Tax=Lachnotalea glycerini TaxID=1763509 RepID=A0A371JI43_9FIRM|nr:nickel ABC transporter permease [Lachnotalea glycerini]RDY32400.1 ABC transporter permease [Lachnotalea glycerini]
MNVKQLTTRLMQAIIVLLGISLMTFMLTYLAPGDPVRTMYAASGVMPDKETLEKTREAMGLNEPFMIQYFKWLSSSLQGDFGTSYSMNKPVASILMSRIGPTLWLAFFSLILMLLISVPAGLLAAVRQNRFTDYFVRGISFLGLSIPNFWVGLLLVYFVAFKLGLFPVVSMGAGIDKMVLPAVTLAFAMSAKYTRQVRAAVLEELNQDYVTGARSRGLKEKTILIRHVFPNALLPLITLIGLSLGSLLGGTAVVEVIFSYPGLGSLAVSAITAYDYPLIQAYVLWIAFLYMLINLIVDLSYGFLDPRIREGRKIYEKNA